MTIVFPNLKPGVGGREIVLGKYPIKRFTMMSGTGVTRRYGSQPFDASMSLTFPNISDTAVDAIVSAYEAASGAYERISFQDLTWDGINTQLRQKLERDYTWRFLIDTPPQIQSVKRNVSTVTVQFQGQRDVLPILSSAVSAEIDETYIINRLDPYFNDVQLLLYMKGRSGSLNFNDSSLKMRLGTIFGNPSISTEKSVFDGSSGRFPNLQSFGQRGDFVKFEANDDFVIETSAYTIETWIYMEDISYFPYAATIFDMRSQGGFSLPSNTFWWQIQSWYGLPYLLWPTGGPTAGTVNATFQLNQWTHIAACRSATGRSALYVNGIEKAVDQDNSSKTVRAPLLVGSSCDYYVPGRFYLSNFRFTTRQCRYTSDFNVPTGPFPSPSNLPAYIPSV